MPQAAPQTVKPARPLSPHLQVYRLPLAALISILLHRIMGIGLTIGMFLVVWWVGAAAYGPSAYTAFERFISSPIGYVLLFGFSLALFFHMCSGIRHLFWDVGLNFEIAQTERGNVIVIIAALALTAVSWFLVLV